MSAAPPPFGSRAKYALQVAAAGIALGPVVLRIPESSIVYRMHLPIGEWTARIAWFLLMAAVAIPLACRRRLPIEDAVFGYVGAVVMALIAVAAIAIIGALAALHGPF